MAKRFAWWKLIGLAGVIGGVATGAAITRQERERRSYSADEIRERLHARHAEIEDPHEDRSARHRHGGSRRSS